MGIIQFNTALSGSVKRYQAPVMQAWKPWN